MTAMVDSTPAGRLRLCPAEEVPEGGGRGFVFGRMPEELRVFVIRWQGRLLAYENACPHAGVSLDWTPDRFFDRNGELLICALHGARFRPDDGLCVAGPCRGLRLTALAIELDDEGVVHALDPGRPSP
jgi:nitrite reductase/ring-hydroxylating ferredoxin subunit